MENVTIYILAISFVATLFRSTFGFGESLIAVPLFILAIPIEEAVPLSVLMSILVALVVVVQDHKQVQLKSAKWLIIFATMGIPLGLLLLIYGNDFIIKIVLGVLIILYSIYSLCFSSKLLAGGSSKAWRFVCGFLSGVLGGAYGLNGPPLVLYGNRMGWSAKHFRATLQAYFLPVGLVSMGCYAVKGLVTEDVLWYFLCAVPVIVPAIFIGRYFNGRLKGNAFYRYAYCGLIVIGGILIINSREFDIRIYQKAS